MALGEAEAIVRKRLDVAAFLEVKSATRFHPFDDFRAFHNKDKSEIIVIIKEPTDSDKVVAVIRIVALPAGYDLEQIKRQLKEKYGQNPQQSIGTHGLWSESENWRKCMVKLGQTYLGQLKVVQRSENIKSYTPTLSVMNYRYRRGQLPPASIWDGCGPTVQYDIVMSKLKIIFYNLAQYTPHILEAEKAADPGSSAK